MNSEILIKKLYRSIISAYMKIKKYTREKKNNEGKQLKTG